MKIYYMKYLDYIYFLLSRNVTKNPQMPHKNGEFLGCMMCTTCSILYLVTWIPSVWILLIAFVGSIIFVELVYDEADYKRLRKIEARYKDMPPEVVRRRAILAQIILPISSFIIMVGVIYLVYLVNK